MRQPQPAITREVGRNEIRPLTGLRFVAATWVVLFHGQVVEPSFLGVAFRVGDPLIRNGILGVDVFFVLSGFILTHTYIERLGPALRLASYRRYLWARISRVWPAFCVMLNLSGLWLFLGSRHHTVLAWSLQVRSPDFTFRGWLTQVLLVHRWFRPYTDGACWFGPGWTVSAEMVAYLMFPILAVFLWRVQHIPLHRLSLLLLSFICPVALIPPLTDNHAYRYSWLMRIVGCFTAGAFAYLIAQRLQAAAKPNSEHPWGRVCIYVIGSSLAVFWCAPSRWSTAVVLLFPLFLIASMLDSHTVKPNMVTSFLSSRPIVYGGRISYSLYLVHMLVFYIYFWVQRSVPALHARTSLGAVYAITTLAAPFVLAHVLYRYVEDPARRWLQRSRLRQRDSLDVSSKA